MSRLPSRLAARGERGLLRTGQEHGKAGVCGIGATGSALGLHPRGWGIIPLIPHPTTSCRYLEPSTERQDETHGRCPRVGKAVEGSGQLEPSLWARIESTDG